MNKNVTDVIKEMTTRIAAASYQMGADGMDKYMASIKVDAIINECFKDLDLTLPGAEPKAAELTTADMMDRISADPDRFIRSISVIERYPSVNDRYAFTIIKAEPKNDYYDKVAGVMFQKNRRGELECIYVTGEKSKRSGYVGDTEYKKVEIPTWVRS